MSERLTSVFLSEIFTALVFPFALRGYFPIQKVMVDENEFVI